MYHLLIKPISKKNHLNVHVIDPTVPHGTEISDTCVATVPNAVKVFTYLSTIECSFTKREVKIAGD